MDVARVNPTVSADRERLLEELMESLCELAKKEGAHECAGIDCKDLVFAETPEDSSDVPVEERSLFWPVPRFPIDSMQDALRQYSRAFVFRLNLSEDRSSNEEQVFMITSLLESACFYGGCHLSIGLAAGNCKEVFCRNEQICQALKTGTPCLHPLKSRPSIEACGLDPRVIAAKAGWGDPEQEAFLVGMVFVG